MNSNKKLLAITTLLLAGFFGAGMLGLLPQTTHNPHCVTLYVDWGTLKTSAPTTTCIPKSSTMSGPDFLTEAGYTIIGTHKYPTQIICRLNGLPASDPCITMPPAHAYWAILIEQNNKWSWAQTGIDQVLLKPGEGIGLVYANNGKVKFPH
jgi:hypothetical protein